MKQFELIADKRGDVGKGASRRLRHAGKLPGIVYGADKEALMISLAHNEVMHHLEHEAFYSHILTLKIGKQTERVVLKDLQRHPYKRAVLHIDLLRVREQETLTMRVPLHFINEEKSLGVKQDGGIINHLMTEIEIVCLPKDLPEYIEVDLINVSLNETLHLSDLKLPDGIQIYSLLHGGDDSIPVASIHTPKGTAADIEEDTATEEAAAEDEDKKEP